MAIAFVRVNIHSRAKGHSSVAGSAYRSGERLKDERTGVVHDFRRRDDVLFKRILLPEGASQHYLNREFLWNEVEKAERYKNAQVAKDVVLALPKELDLAHWIALSESFAKYHFVDKGLVVDIAIHNHSDGNPHAHLYITTRRLLSDGFSHYKARDLNPGFAKGFVSGKDEWGVLWRTHQNDYFRAHHLDLVVDQNHVIAQRHEGKVSQGLHYLKEQNRLRRRLSHAILMSQPRALLHMLSERQGVFSERDIASLVFKTTKDKNQFDKVYHQLLNQKQLIKLGTGDDKQIYYTTKRHYQREAHMAACADTLASRKRHPVLQHVIKTQMAQHTLTAEQEDVLHYVLGGRDIRLVQGYAGTGKSTLMRIAKQCWKRCGYHVHGIALSAIAARRLHEHSGIPSQTIASLRLKLKLQKLTLHARDILIMDEASMTNLSDMNAIVNAVKDAKAKLILIGDTQQLQPIGGGAPFRALIERVGCIELQHIQRQINPKERQLSQALAEGHIQTVLQAYDKQSRLHWATTREDAKQHLVDHWAQSTGVLTDKLILAYRKVDVAHLNHLARERLQSNGTLTGPSLHYSNEQGTLVLQQGERILCTKNDKALGVCNGDRGQIVHLISNSSFLLELSNGQRITLQAERYPHIDYGYALTVHKAQGLTVKQSHVYMDGKYWNRHSAYVALSRHQEHAHVFTSHESYPNRHQLTQQLEQTTRDETVLDWPLSLALRHGFDPDSIAGKVLDKIGTRKEQTRVKTRADEVWQHTDWAKLNTLQDKRIDYLLEYQALYQQTQDKMKRQGIQQSGEKLLMKVLQDTQLREHVKARAPQLYAHYSRNFGKELAREKTQDRERDIS